jgi:hypothetical protein
MKKIRYWLLHLSIPIQKIMQKMHPPEPQTTFSEANFALQRMRQGDILLSREAWHFTNLFIPGYWSHAAIYGYGKVIESVAPSVQEVNFFDWVLKKHNWCVIRFDDKDATLAFNRATSAIGSNYDYEFDWGAQRAFYCSRLVYFYLQMTSKKFSETFTLRETFGEPTVTPDDFYNSTKDQKLKLIYEHRDK